MHWKKINFMNDIMTPVIMANGIITNFTLLFLNETDWYKVNFDILNEQ